MLQEMKDVAKSNLSLGVCVPIILKYVEPRAKTSTRCLPGCWG